METFEPEPDNGIRSLPCTRIVSFPDQHSDDNAVAEPPTWNDRRACKPDERIVCTEIASRISLSNRIGPNMTIR